MPIPRVSVIIPALNEAENVPLVLPRIPPDVHEVILVDGQSTDGTVEAARRSLPTIRVVQQQGPGKGNALRTGFAAATGDVIVMLDADGSTDPGEIPLFVHALLGGADFAKGSRFLHGAGTSDMQFHRRMGNQFFVLLVRLLFGGRYTDLCYGYNAFWRTHLPQLDLDGEGFEIETMMNLRALKAHLRIQEVPSYEALRLNGVSRLKAVPDGIRVLRTIFREWRRDPPFARSKAMPAFRGLVPISIGISFDEPVGRGHAVEEQRAAFSTPAVAFHVPTGSVGVPPISAAEVMMQSLSLLSPSSLITGSEAAEPGGIGSSAPPANGHPTDEHPTDEHPTNGQSNGHPTTGHPTNGHAIDSEAEGLAAVLVPLAAPADRLMGWTYPTSDSYIARLNELLLAIDRSAIAQVVSRLRAARDAGAMVFIAGNGGSSATAAHWVNDLSKATRQSGRRPFRVIGLTDNVPWLTALANDEGYERVFSGQLENLARPGDLLVVISASGNSPNILAAIARAKELGVGVIGLLGFDGGHARGLVDDLVLVESEIGAYGVVESAHAAISDIITTCLIGDTLPAFGEA